MDGNSFLSDCFLIYDFTMAIAFVFDYMFFSFVIVSY